MKTPLANIKIMSQLKRTKKENAYLGEKVRRRIDELFTLSHLKEDGKNPDPSKK